MQLPGGQVNPGLSFFRAIQDLVQRPNPSGQNQQTSGATDPASAQEPPRTDAQQATSPTSAAGRAEAAGIARSGEMPSPAQIDNVRQTVGGGQFIPRGSFLNIVV